MDPVRPSLFMKAALIGTSNPWALTASSGVIQLAPIRATSAEDRRARSEESVLLDLTELGYFDPRCVGTRRAPMSSSNPIRSGVVLLLPWSVVPTLAMMDARARDSRGDGLMPDKGWLPTWHHFVQSEDEQTSAVPTMTRRAHALDVLLAPGPWR